MKQHKDGFHTLPLLYYSLHLCMQFRPVPASSLVPTFPKPKQRQISRQDGRRVGSPAGPVPSDTCGADLISLGETWGNHVQWLLMMTLRLCYGRCLYVLFDVVCRRIPQRRDMSLQRLFCLMRARVCHRSTTGIVEKMRGWQEHEINSWYALNPVCVWLCDAKGSWAALETLFREHSCYTCSWGASDSDSFIPKVRVLHEMYRTS